jgi:hypothetical protein
MRQPDSSIRTMWSVILCLTFLIFAFPSITLALQAQGFLQRSKLSVIKFQQSDTQKLEKWISSPAMWTSVAEEMPQDFLGGPDFAINGIVPRFQLGSLGKRCLPKITAKIPAHLFKSVLNL